MARFRMSKAVAIGIGVLTVSAVCGLVLLSVMYQIQINEFPPASIPTPTKPPVLPTGLPPTLRLPDNVIPESYKVFLQLYVYSAITNNYTNQSFAFTGNSTVRIKCMRDSKSIFLHVLDLNVTTVEVRKSDSNEKLSLSGYRIHQNESNFLEIQLKDVMTGNETYYDVFTKFEGELQNDLTGFYVSRYTKKAKAEEDEDQETFLATSLMQPTAARKVFPCFDEPALKAKFKITIIHRPDTVALSNQNGLSLRQIDGEEWSVTTFEETQNMSTYLLAFTVLSQSDFELLSEESSTDIKIRARREAIRAGYADYALEVTEKILNHYDYLFGLKHKLKKIDQIALPEISVGSMESWGLISYQESALLVEQNTALTFDHERVATQIAHELAHEWFGSLVTMRWWNDLWLKEGLATYMAYFGVEAVGWNLRDLFVLRETQTAFQMDSLNSSHPLSTQENYIQTTSEIVALFDDVTYRKSAAVLRMLASYIGGEETLMKGIKTYLTKFEFQTAAHKDLWECLQQETNKDVEAFMSTWIEQVGYPVVTIDTQKGELTQEQFLLKQEGGHNIAWHIDIRYFVSSGFSVKSFMLQVSGPAESTQFEVKDKDEWLLANINCIGFFRVNYDEENWNKLRMQLERDHYVSVNAISVACSNGLSDCTTMASNLFKSYRNGTNNIHPNLRREIYCSAIASGDDEDWEFAWNEYQRATAPAEKDKLRYALSCTKEIWLLNRYLQYTLDPTKIRKTDIVSTINYIAKNVAGQPLAWDFVRGYWSYITQECGVGVISLGDLLDAVTKRFSTHVELEELRQFQREQDKDTQGLAAQALEQVIERTEANIEWVKENKQLVKDWFESN
ncbi:aminopeptidase N-like [Garra rufa]|uniref:aminopeptidase N-like n=1 Tax=Garra rufa TaxID=137080 RepID=UPI003CCE9785